MADTKVTSNGNVQFWWVPEASISNPASPTASEINTSGINISEAISWETSSFPGSTGSNDVDDRSIMDRGNATSRGFAQFEADLSFFRPFNILDLTDTYGKAFNAFRTPRVTGYLITRVLQGTTGVPGDVAAGEWVDVMKFMASSFVDDTEGEDSVKYSVSFMPQGTIYVNTQVKGANPVTITVADVSLDVDDLTVARATLNSKRATQAVRWESSNPAVANITQNGVITALSAGTADITATHPAATGATVPVEVTVTGP